MPQTTMTFKIEYGPNCKYETAKELIEHVDEIGTIIFSYGDVFHQRDELRKVINKLVSLIGVLEDQQAMTNETLDKELKTITKLIGTI